MCRTAAVNNNEIQPGEEWIEKLDINAFAADITALGKRLEAEQGKDDVRHLNKMIMWSNVCAALGLLTMGIRVNLFSIVTLSTFTFSRWTMIAHHTCKYHSYQGFHIGYFLFDLLTFLILYAF
jgi:hypothetical protein